MTETIEILKRKIARVQRELGEVSAALDELAGSAGGADSSQLASTADPRGGIRFSERTELQPLLEGALAEMGIDLSQPAPTPREVQQRMLAEGVQPEENILSRGIVEAREE